MHSEIRHDWTFQELNHLFEMPFNDLILKSHLSYRHNFKDYDIQLSTLLNIKTGGCPENCCYCAQSAHYKTNLQKANLLDLQRIEREVKKAKLKGSNRFCFAAAWRNLNDRDLEYIYKIIDIIKNEGLESCASLGMLNSDQAKKLKKVGLDFYNHNIDTSEDFYSNIVTTRSYSDRLSSIANIQNSGINLCCGGILGMGESNIDRINMILSLANLNEHPLSVPINKLVPIKGTPLANSQTIDNLDFIRIISLARITMPKSYIRLAAGRKTMSEEMQVLALFAGANSIFYGEKLLTTENPECHQDKELLRKLGVNTKKYKEIPTL